MISGTPLQQEGCVFNSRSGAVLCVVACSYCICVGSPWVLKAFPGLALLASAQFALVQLRYAKLAWLNHYHKTVGRVKAVEQGDIMKYIIFPQRDSSRPWWVWLLTFIESSKMENLPSVYLFAWSCAFSALVCRQEPRSAADFSLLLIVQYTDRTLIYHLTCISDRICTATIKNSSDGALLWLQVPGAVSIGTAYAFNIYESLLVLFFCVGVLSCVTCPHFITVTFFFFFFTLH